MLQVIENYNNGKLAHFMEIGMGGGQEHLVQLYHCVWGQSYSISYSRYLYLKFSRQGYKIDNRFVIKAVIMM